MEGETSSTPRLGGEELGTVEKKETDSLLGSPDENDNRKEESLFPWKHTTPPRWWILCRKHITKQRITITVALFFLIIATCLFAFSEVENHKVLNLEGISNDHFLTFEVDLLGERSVLEVLCKVQEIDSSYPTPTTVTFRVYGCSKASGCIPIDDSWSIEAEVDSETDELLHDFYLNGNSKLYTSHKFDVRTNSELPLAITLKYRELSGAIRFQVAIAATILVGVYILIMFELLHRALAAILGSFICLGVVSVIHGRPTFETVINWIDFQTVGLLFGMMVILGIFSETGFFEWCAIKAFKLSRGNIWRLTLILCIFTGICSAFLDNVTTILLITPVTIRLCKVLDLDPQPIIISLVMLSNIGGTATPIGDPPNIIIVNDPRIIESGEVTFVSFCLHMAPGTIVAGVSVIIMLYFIYRSSFKRKPHSHQIREIEIWKHTLSAVPGADDEERAVRDQLQEFISQLEYNLKNNPEPEKYIDMEKLEAQYQIRDWPLLISSTIVLACVILMFFLHSWIEEVVSLTLAWIAIIGAIFHLLVSGIHDLDKILEKVEWSTLVFFAALFVLMHGLTILGLVEWIGDKVYDIIAAVPGDSLGGDGRLIVAILLILWVSAYASAFIDNIPYTTAMVPVIVSLAESDLGLPLTPLIWSLSFGACFGGNGSLIGASANVVAVGLAEHNGCPISFWQFLKAGIPCMTLSVIVASVYLLVFHVVVPWY